MVTDARFPERWLHDRRVLRLSDSAFRVFVTSLAWSVSNRTDGVLDEADLTLLPCLDVSCVDELAKSGLWRCEGGGWVIVDYVTTQTTRDELDLLDQNRRVAREKKQRQRSKARVGSRLQSPGRSRGRSTGTVPGDCAGQERPGQERPGQERPGQERPGQERPGQERRQGTAGTCVDCGSPGPGLLAREDDGRMRCRRCHFSQRTAS
jgi:hypothetical protein